MVQQIGRDHEHRTSGVGDGTRRRPRLPGMGVVSEERIVGECSRDSPSCDGAGADGDVEAGLREERGTGLADPAAGARHERDALSGSRRAPVVRRYIDRRVATGGPAIIEVAVNGLTTRGRNPHVPRSPDAVAATALRLPSTPAPRSCTPTRHSIDLPRRACSSTPKSWLGRPRASGPTRCSTRRSCSVTDDERAACPPATPLIDPRRPAGRHGRPGMRERDLGGRRRPADCTRLRDRTSTPSPDIHYAFELCERLALGPSMPIYEPTWLNHTLAFHRAGRLPPGAMVKLYFGGPNGYFARGEGVSFGLPPTAKAFERLPGDAGAEARCPWSVSALGGDLLRTPIARLALEAGGHLKVGLEDYAGPGSPTNEELVARAAQLVADTGRPVASPGEAARILGLPR